MVVFLLFFPIAPIHAYKGFHRAGLDVSVNVPSHLDSNVDNILLNYDFRLNYYYGLFYDLWVGASASMTLNSTGMIKGFKFSENDQYFNNNLHFKSRSFNFNLNGKYLIIGGYNIKPYLTFSCGYLYSVYNDVEYNFDNGQSVPLNSPPGPFSRWKPILGSGILFEYVFLDTYSIGIGATYQYVFDDYMTYRLLFPVSIGWLF